MTPAPISGRSRAISSEVLASLQRELREPEGFRSYGEVQFCEKGAYPLMVQR
ncbi:hypothetical protein [Leptodesmis sp.]|uniref:hypothetical protein n=1 Tax=Leptodesmis sp. TaxID=3100501 RepID=UPI00405351D4